MDMNEFRSKLKNKTVMVDFSAPWCAPCRAMEPVIDKIRTTYAGKASIITINIDHHGSFATDHMVQSIPTLIIYKNGQEMKRLVGIQPQAIIENCLDAVLENRISTENI